MRRLCYGLLILLVVCHGRVGRAAAPVLDYLYPAGGQRGATLTITGGGKFESWPVQGWADSPEIKIEPAAGNGTFIIKIGEKTATGPHLIRVYNGDGASALRVFMVGQQREINET